MTERTLAGLRYDLALLELEWRNRADTALRLGAELHAEAPGQARLAVAMTLAHRTVYTECADKLRDLLA